MSRTDPGEKEASSAAVTPHVEYLPILTDRPPGNTVLQCPCMCVIPISASPGRPWYPLPNIQIATTPKDRSHPVVHALQPEPKEIYPYKKNYKAA